MEYESTFLEWAKQWELTNPKPTLDEVEDKVMFYGVTAVAIGAVLLSGTRTGAVIGSTEQLSSFFMEHLAFSEKWRPIFNFIESVFGMLTIEASLLVGGYYLGKVEETPNMRKWIMALIITAFAPGIMANLSPAVSLMGLSTQHIYGIMVNVVIGVSTIVLAWIAGRIFKLARFDVKIKYQNSIKEWEKRRNSSWIRSKERRALNGKSTLTQQILSSISSEPQTLQQLREQFGEKSVKEVHKLLKTQLIKREGNKVKVL